MMVKPSMTHLRLTTLVILVFLAQAALAARDYWVWKDDNGVTNFSEQKPKDRPAQHITSGIAENPENWRRPGQSAPQTGPEDPAPAASGSGTTAGRQAASKAKGPDPDEVAAEHRKQVAQQIAAAKARNCQKARSDMQTLKNRPRVRIVGKDGKQHVMSPDEIQKKIDTFQKIIDDNC